MALVFSPNWAPRMADHHVDTFSPIGFAVIALQIYNTLRPQPSDGYTSPGAFDTTNRLIYTSGIGFVESSGELIFDGANYPAPVAATLAGTASWVDVRTGNIGAAFTGSVTLAGGDGLIHIANGGEGGGSGLNVQVGDVISIVGFRMKWS